MGDSMGSLRKDRKGAADGGIVTAGPDPGASFSTFLTLPKHSSGDRGAKKLMISSFHILDLTNSL
jgi:hypothetical protein